MWTECKTTKFFAFFESSSQRGRSIIPCESRDIILKSKLIRVGRYARIQKGERIAAVAVVIKNSVHQNGNNIDRVHYFLKIPLDFMKYSMSMLQETAEVQDCTLANY